ncbi:response regulator [Kangiella sediminilitoris]|uniref:Transcriptional regulator n=1 Tax=Kangiella sediminilitoris TaxID=1144748 RepID=A0A1B3BD75_9GAMM|nr:response regulator [Kangiella sediminilitoris]AOE50766.1 transcriptional regulator [Kangiella sediminilitoris]
MTKLLIADDDTELCQLLQEYLSQEGFDITVAHDGASAAQLILNESFDLMVLDVMLPNMNGFDVLKEVRKESQVPILMLTARGDEIDRIVGLELGADDYIGKPCNPRELTARIRSILRRTETDYSSNKKKLRSIHLEDLYINPGSREALVNNEAIKLTATEFDILYLLASQAGELVKRDDLSEKCLGRSLEAYDRSIDMHISNLRRKLGTDSHGDERIKTVRGVGYQYVSHDT